MCGIRFTISASHRKEVERHLKTAQRLGQVRQVKYLLAILAVVDGQSFAQVAWVLHVHEQTVATWVRLFCCYGPQDAPRQKPTGRRSRAVALAIGSKSSFTAQHHPAGRHGDLVSG